MRVPSGRRVPPPRRGRSEPANGAAPAGGRDPVNDRACLNGHKSPGGILRWSGQVISLVGETGGGTTKRHRPLTRGAITCWSERSRRRLVFTVLASPAASWGERDDPSKIYLVTLTYPGQDGCEHVPRDGRIAQAQRARFVKSWKRKFGGVRCVWKTEFQARAGEWEHDWQRCAVHWTFWIEAPDTVPLEAVREWVADRWWRIVGSGAGTHLAAGTKVQPWQGSLVRYALKYMGKGPDKEYQHRVPDGYVNVGRWWGLVGLPVRWIEVGLSEHEFFRGRRLILKSMQRARRRRGRVKIRGRYSGMWMWARRGGEVRTRELIEHTCGGSRRMRNAKPTRGNADMSESLDGWIVPPDSASRRKRGPRSGWRTETMAQPLIELVEHFCTYQRKQKGKTQGGVQTYRWNLEQFMVFLRKREGRLARVGDVNAATIQGWMDEMATADLAVSTMRVRQSTLSSLCGWLVKRSILAANRWRSSIVPRTEGSRRARCRGRR